jgi:hypothetical protein
MELIVYYYYAVFVIVAKEMNIYLDIMNNN